jgi:hypothetical protein
MDDVMARMQVADEKAKTVDFVPDKENSERLQKWLEGLDPDTMGRYKM